MSQQHVDLHHSIYRVINSYAVSVHDEGGVTIKRGAQLIASARLALAAAAATLLLGLAPAVVAPGARAEAPVPLDPSGTSISAYGGWAAWSRLDTSTGGYALVTRSPQGAISLPAVAKSPVPFDVELGRAPGAGVAAVYSRCADSKHLKGCHILMLELDAAEAVEHSLTPPGGGSNHQPAIWNGSIAFLRRNPAGGARRPDRLFEWKLGSRSVQALALPSSRGNRRERWPAGLTGRIRGLAFNGKQLAYVTLNFVPAVFHETTLWFQPVGGRPQLIDQQVGGASNGCPQEFVSPLLSGRWLYAYLNACDGDPRLDRLTRYRHGEVQRATYSLAHYSDDYFGSVVIDGTSVDWSTGGGVEPGYDGAGVVERLQALSWRRIAPPVPQTFCSRADVFC